MPNPFGIVQTEEVSKGRNPSSDMKSSLSRGVEQKGPITAGEALRRSGMALEFVVGEMVPQLVGRGYKMLAKGRYFYEADEKTPEGQSKPSEADVWALGGWTSGPNSVEHAWFIECKERESRDREKQWCFFPPQDNVRDLSQNAFMIDILDHRDGLHPARLAGLMSAFYPSIPVVGEGIEIFMKEGGNWTPNPESVSNAIRQAIMPIGHHLRWPLHRNFLLDYEGQAVELYLPVVITTAKLQILRRDTSVMRHG